MVYLYSTIKKMHGPINIRNISIKIRQVECVTIKITLKSRDFIVVFYPTHTRARARAHARTHTRARTHMHTRALLQCYTTLLFRLKLKKTSESSEAGVCVSYFQNTILVASDVALMVFLSL